MSVGSNFDKTELNIQSGAQDTQEGSRDVGSLSPAQLLTNNLGTAAHPGLLEGPLVERAVARSGLCFDSFVRAISSTAFGRMVTWSLLDLERLLIAAERMGLDPTSGEIYAVAREVTSEGVPVNSYQDNRPAGLILSVDGWCRVINSHPQFDGICFTESPNKVDGMPEFIECTIHRKDRGKATKIREYMCEANTGNGAWLSHPRRMLRHRAMAQCARVCLGLGVFVELDEATRSPTPLPAGAPWAGRVNQSAAQMTQGTQALKSILKARGPEK